MLCGLAGRHGHASYNRKSRGGTLADSGTQAVANWGMRLPIKNLQNLVDVVRWATSEEGCSEVVKKRMRVQAWERVLGALRHNLGGLTAAWRLAAWHLALGHDAVLSWTETNLLQLESFQPPNVRGKRGCRNPALPVAHCLPQRPKARRNVGRSQDRVVLREPKWLGQRCDPNLDHRDKARR